MLCTPALLHYYWKLFIQGSQPDGLMNYQVLGKIIFAGLLYTTFSFPLPFSLVIGVISSRACTSVEFPPEIPSLSVFSTSVFLLNFCSQEAVPRGTAQPCWSGRDRREGALATFLVPGDLPDAKNAWFPLLCSALGVSSVEFLAQCV